MRKEIVVMHFTWCQVLCSALLLCHLQQVVTRRRRTFPLILQSPGAHDRTNPVDQLDPATAVVGTTYDNVVGWLTIKMKHRWISWWQYFRTLSMSPTTCFKTDGLLPPCYRYATMAFKVVSSMPACSVPDTLLVATFQPKSSRFFCPWLLALSATMSLASL